MEFKNIIAPDTLENLVDLLNKHMKETRGKNEDIGEYLNYAEDGRRVFLYEIDGAYYDIDECVILSKRYGFIKRLVDNDKINTGGKITEDLTYEYFQIPRKYFRGGKYARLSEEMNDIFYHRILACLSIQDNPIEYLISVLR